MKVRESVLVDTLAICKTAWTALPAPEVEVNLVNDPFWRHLIKDPALLCSCINYISSISKCSVLSHLICYLIFPTILILLPIVYEGRSPQNPRSYFSRPAWQHWTSLTHKLEPSPRASGFDISFVHYGPHWSTESSKELQR